MAYLPGVRVHVLVRVKEPDLANGHIVDPEPPEGPLVLGAKPDLAGHPWGERQGTDLAEIVRQEIFVERLRVDVVAHHPDFQEKCVCLLEEQEVECTWIKIKGVERFTSYHPLFFW